MEGRTTGRDDRAGPDLRRLGHTGRGAGIPAASRKGSRPTSPGRVRRLRRAAPDRSRSLRVAGFLAPDTRTRVTVATGGIVRFAHWNEYAA
ncbi:hypothetical protein GCM10010166_13450 [Couchioplanes caeruleus subsp. azureus]|nr:hypothetical protein GCM10010166_13450 [Couchioplanes caeruleus subsp. azureus]